MPDLLQDLDQLLRRVPKERPEELIKDVLYTLLSKRELSIIQVLGKHDTAKGIGKALNISENTVRASLTKIYKKLGVYSKSQLVVLAVYAGFVRLSHVELDLWTVITWEVRRQKEIERRKHRPK